MSPQFNAPSHKRWCVLVFRQCHAWILCDWCCLRRTGLWGQRPSNSTRNGLFSCPFPVAHLWFDGLKVEVAFCLAVILANSSDSCPTTFLQIVLT